MTDPTFTLADALRFATEQHRGQTDKLGVDYIEHVLAVADGLVEFDVDLQIAAMLHDVVEDCPVTLEDLRVLGVSERSIAAVAAVSRNLHAELDYQAGIERIIGSPDATLVKIADNAHNSAPYRTAELARATGKPGKPRYATARATLWAAAPLDDVVRIVSRVAPALLRELPGRENTLVMRDTTDSGGRTYRALTLESSGELRLTGQDLGPAVEILGGDEYEFERCLSPEDVTTLREAMGWAADADLLACIAESFPDSAAFETLVVGIGVPGTFWNRVR